jgi:hypothetical protein
MATASRAETTFTVTRILTASNKLQLPGLAEVDLVLARIPDAN